MGLVKRGKIWWMNFTYDGRRVRRSTDTSDKRLAEAILAKVRVQIVEGKFFENPRLEDHTFEEMMGRYMRECSVAKSPKSATRDRGSLNHLLPLFGDMVLNEITPKLLARYKTQRRLEQAAPATINKELQLVRHAFNLAAREWEWCRENPMHRVSMEPVRNEVLELTRIHKNRGNSPCESLQVSRDRTTHPASRAAAAEHPPASHLRAERDVRLLIERFCTSV